MTLETSSTETGSKDFVAVGTTINRGEDLAAKGSVRLIRRVEWIRPDQSVIRHISLRLLKLSPTLPWLPNGGINYGFALVTMRRALSPQYVDSMVI